MSTQKTFNYGCAFSPNSSDSATIVIDTNILDSLTSTIEQNPAVHNNNKLSTSSHTVYHLCTVSTQKNVPTSNTIMSNSVAPRSNILHENESKSSGNMILVSS